MIGQFVASGVGGEFATTTFLTLLVCRISCNRVVVVTVGGRSRAPERGMKKVENSKNPKK
jgi:hypothetical protein